ncbi:MAG: UDP-2,3-diacylglucosamine diphosphatase [Cytophagales bacterium]|nr:UDP-2,3-diacylglucosamine diphosphatase [Cytophagales bacterium]
MAHQPESINVFKELPEGKNLYFASDFHLGTPDEESSLVREKKIIKWLDAVENDAAGIILVGDIFDFWYEYKKVIPIGFLRFQAKLINLLEKNIPVIFFTGNHDAWMFDYFPNEIGIPIYRKPIVMEVGEQQLYVGHGDGLGPGDYFYKFLKKVFRSKISHWLFRWIHPDVGMALAQIWSRSSRLSSSRKDLGFKSKEGEWLWQYSMEIETTTHHDYYIFGHRHIPLELEVGDRSKYLNLGEWVNHFTYVKYDGKKAELLSFSD